MRKLQVIIILLLLVAPVVVVARHEPNPNAQIPEANGTYDDPEHQGIKVRVFVHKVKGGGKPSPTQALVCGLEDPQSTEVIAAGGWHLPANWAYNLNPGSVPGSVDGANLATIAANGFSDWTSASGGAVNFNRGSDTSVNRQSFDGVNAVAWGRTSGTALGTTYIRYNSVTGVVVDVDTIMNQKFAWRWSNSSSCAYTNSYDAENILTHELGHWIGLDDEYDEADQHATMFGYADRTEVKKNTLSVGDQAGALNIYVSP